MPNIFDRIFKRKAVQPTQPLPFQLMWTGAGFTMIPYNVDSYIKNGYNGNSAVYSVVNALMQKFAAPPFYLYEVKNTKALRQYKELTKHGYSDRAMMLKATSMDEVSDSHPIAKLLARPNNYQSDGEFRQMALCFLKLTGMAPIWANKGGSGIKPLSLHVLPPQWVTLKADDYLWDAEQVYFSPYGATTQPLNREDVHLWKYFNPEFMTDGSHLYGLSPLKAGLMDIKASNEATVAMAKMYENGGARGVFTPNEVIGQEQINKLRDLVASWVNGTQNKGSVGSLSVPLTYHDIGMDAVDMALLQGKAITDERIATIFNYPPALLKADNKYDNANAAIKYVVTNSLFSDFNGYRDLWNNFVLPMFGETGRYYVDYDISVLPEMQQDMEKLVAQAEKMWWTTGNEKRALTKYDTLPDPAMDTVFIPTGMTPISETLMADDVDITEDYDNEKAAI